VEAPFAGRVGVVDASVGSYLQPGDAIAALYSVDTLEVRFDVPQRIAERVESGAPVELDDRRLEVATITPAADQATRTFTAIAPVGEEPPPELRPGAFVDVALTVAERADALFVPETALLRVGERSYVFVADDGTARRVQVETGVVDGGRIEVRGDVAAGQQVVTAGLEKLRDGTAITPVEGATS